jgi:hypothetical protein
MSTFSDKFSDAVSALSTGPLHRFADWANAVVPSVCAGVYTIWNNDGCFMYVGMSGQKITANSVPKRRREGLSERLQSHASGRRSGDQFCVYVADRLVLPQLTASEIAEIAAGRHSFDAFVRRYIHQHLSYRFVLLPDGKSAYEVERTILLLGLNGTPPLLNPSKQML